MGQGTLRIDAVVLLELMANTIDLNELRRRLLLPENYQLTSLVAQNEELYGPTVLIHAASPEIPDDAQVLLTYRREPGEIVVMRRETTTLVKCDVLTDAP